MSIPNTLNALPFFGQMDLQTAIYAGRLNPPSDKVIPVIVAACIAAGCAIGAACEAIGTTIVCVCAVGAICYTAIQLQRMYEQLRDDYAKMVEKCGKLPEGSEERKNCDSLLHLLYNEMMKAYWRWQSRYGGIGRAGTGQIPNPLPIGTSRQ